MIKTLKKRSELYDLLLDSTVKVVELKTDAWSMVDGIVLYVKKNNESNALVISATDDGILDFSLLQKEE